MELYVLVTWPESQLLMEEEWFESECVLMNDKNLLVAVGCSAYFVPYSRYKEFLSQFNSEAAL